MSSSTINLLARIVGKDLSEVWENADGSDESCDFSAFCRALRHRMMGLDFEDAVKCMGDLAALYDDVLNDLSATADAMKIGCKTALQAAICQPDSPSIVSFGLLRGLIRFMRHQYEKQHGSPFGAEDFLQHLYIWLANRQPKSMRCICKEVTSLYYRGRILGDRDARRGLKANASDVGKVRTADWTEGVPVAMRQQVMEWLAWVCIVRKEGRKARRSSDAAVSESGPLEGVDVGGMLQWLSQYAGGALNQWENYGHVEYWCGMVCDELQDRHAEAVAWYQRAAEQGHADAQNNLGVCYANGKGVSQDHAEAVVWHRRAAEQGHADAQYHLGVCYANGEGVSQDHAEAVVWHRRAAEQGHAEAQYHLGVCYANGKGVSQDHAEAVVWYRRAAEQGHAEAQYHLGICYANGEGVSQHHAEAVVWLRRAAEQGDADAQYALGVCYDSGKGVSQDYAEGVVWYQRAAEQGHAGAQYNLGYCYDNGEGVSQDHAEAVVWYRRAAEQGDASAQYHLGICYANGKGVSQDHAEAVVWYERAAEQGYARAQSALRGLE